MLLAGLVAVLRLGLMARPARPACGPGTRRRPWPCLAAATIAEFSLSSSSLRLDRPGDVNVMTRPTRQPPAASPDDGAEGPRGPPLWSRWASSKALLSFSRARSTSGVRASETSLTLPSGSDVLCRSRVTSSMRTLSRFKLSVTSLLDSGDDTL